MTIESIQANPRYIKYINKRQILHYIKKHQGNSRAEISKALLISKPTISKAVDELLKEGWIWESESTTSNTTGGRKPFHIYFNENAQYIVGVDIGGTNVEIAFINLAGHIVEKTIFSTQTYLSENLVEKIADCILMLLEEANIDQSKIFGVGIGVPGITDVYNGIVSDAPSLGWKEYPLREEIQKLLSFPVYIDNDVNAAALGEHWKGAGQGKHNILQITLGTGIGCGLIINDELYRGATFAAGEIGYMVTDKSAAEKSYRSAFTGYGFLDSHAGGPSIIRRMYEYLGNSELKKDLTAKRVFEMALEGEEVALQVVNEAISHLSFALVNVISVMNPECVVLSGGISRSLQTFLPHIRTTISKHVPVTTEVTITKHPNASLLGAAYLILKEHESILQV